MPVRPDVRAAQQHVQETVRIIRGSRVEVIIHAQPRRCRGAVRDFVEQGLGDQPYLAHGFILLRPLAIPAAAFMSGLPGGRQPHLMRWASASKAWQSTMARAGSKAAILTGPRIWACIARS